MSVIILYIRKPQHYTQCRTMLSETAKSSVHFFILSYVLAFLIRLRYLQRTNFPFFDNWKHGMCHHFTVYCRWVHRQAYFHYRKKTGIWKHTCSLPIRQAFEIFHTVQLINACKAKLATGKAKENSMHKERKTKTFLDKAIHKISGN